MTNTKAIFRPNSRKAAIFELVENDGSALVEQLAEKFGTSVETIRRDLNFLADAGKVRKVHGGAVRVSTSVESAFGERANQNILAKQLVAEKLVKVVQPGQSVMIDTGTTTLACAELLSQIQGLIVITNSVRVASAVSKNGRSSKVKLLGGTYLHDNAQTVGSATISEIGRFRVDHAVLTVGALDEYGISDYSEEEALVARAMVDVAARITVVADNSKLGHRTTYQVCELTKIDTLILDSAPGETLGEALRAAKVEVL